MTIFHEKGRVKKRFEFRSKFSSNFCGFGVILGALRAPQNRFKIAIFAPGAPSGAPRGSQEAPGDDLGAI